MKSLACKIAIDAPGLRSGLGMIRYEAHGNVCRLYRADSLAGEAPFKLARNGHANVKVPPPSSALSKEFEGAWEGTHEVDRRVRRVGLKLWTAADGTAAATLIAVEHGNLEIPVTTVTIKGKDLQLEARAVSGTYRGTLGAGGEMAGEWSEGPHHFPLTFKRVSSETKKP